MRRAGFVEGGGAHFGELEGGRGSRSVLMVVLVSSIHLCCCLCVRRRFGNGSDEFQGEDTLMPEAPIITNLEL